MLAENIDLTKLAVREVIKSLCEKSTYLRKHVYSSFPFG